MAEKKISKTAQKELDRQNLRNFTQQVFTITMEMIVTGTENLTTKHQISIAINNYNRYIKISAYGRKCSILIYHDGNIALKLYEALHCPYSKKLFAFTLDKAAQREFLDHFKKVLTWLIPVFTENYDLDYDFHTYMDYVDREPESGDFESAYKLIKDDFAAWNAADSK